MSGHGAPDFSGDTLAGLAVGEADLSRLKIAIVASQWHSQIMDALIDGARRTLARAGIADTRVIRVPGSFELPLGAQAAAPACDAIIALGVVIRGGTPHFDYVCRAATDGLMEVSLRENIPIGFGLLTCDDEDQARDRAGLAGSSEDKGAEAAEAAIYMALLIRGLRQDVP